MTLTRYTIDDVGQALSFRRLSHFVSNLPPTSATWRALNPTLAPWVDGTKTDALLADVFDVINALRHQHAMANRNPKHRPPRPPEPYPRPWLEVDRGETIGRDGIPISQFAQWWEEAAPCQTE